MKTYLPIVQLALVVLCLWVGLPALAQEKITLTGQIKSSSDQKPMPGVTITLKGSLQGSVSDEKGEFSFTLPNGDHVLIFSFLGYQTLERPVKIPGDSNLKIQLQEIQMELFEIEIVSTGYQEIPKERATGSFVQVDKDLIDRRFSTNLLERLEDVTPSLLINREGPGEGIRIRGRNTIFANTAPLIILDNFPYDGPLENINPNDVESITVLTDAAAASIWGAQAGNGVIVITTKSGKSGQETRISLSTNVSVTERPDLYYKPVARIETFLDLEEDLFGRGFYAVRENNANHPALSPWIETLISHRNGQITEDEKNRQRSLYAASDFREELYRHYYRPEVKTQHYIGLQGGDQNGSYAFSAGYDANQANVIGNSDHRITLNAKGDWTLLKNKKLRLSAGIYYTSNFRQTTTEVPEAFPYERLADESGIPLSIIQKYSRRFAQAITLDGALDWNYIPLRELGQMDFRNLQEEIRANLSASYQFTDWLSAEVLYQRWRNTGTNSSLYPEFSFFSRDLINRFVQVGSNGAMSYPIPAGSILDRSNGYSDSYNFRNQLRFQKSFGGGEFFGLAGFEVRDLQSENNSARYYGYEKESGTSATVPYTIRFPSLVNGSLGLIPAAGTTHPVSIDRFLSQYANVAYSYAGKYTVSASARKDASNLFGVNANQRGVPLWSTGLAWILSEEGFFQMDWISFLKLRATYGYSGNINRSVTAFITARSLPGSLNGLTGQPYAQITNPPNPQLRWEKIGTLNLAFDFASTNDRFNGTVEWYQKNGTDLFGDFPVAPSTGVSQLRGNFASTLARGVDIQLNSKNVVGNNFNWDTRFFLSTVKEKVTEYDREADVINYMAYFGTVPVEGRPLFGVYSYPWAGLDPVTGDPRGILDGEPSTDYLSILLGATQGSIIYHGPSRPTVFGSLMNNFSFKGLSLSFNVSYRLGYFYKRNSVDYTNVYSGLLPHADFEKRWIQPGDELITQIPSLPENANSLRDLFFVHSESLVERGDNIRLQDLRLGYSFDTSNWGGSLSKVEWFFYANNLGIIWKSSNDPLDPDFRSMRPLRSLATGIRIEF